MDNLKFEWNAAKAARNLVKYGVSFNDAKSVFWDDDARMIADPQS